MCVYISIYSYISERVDFIFIMIDVVYKELVVKNVNTHLYNISYILKYKLHFFFKV